MSEDGAWFLLRAFALAPLVLRHVYKMCYHFEAFCEAGIDVKAGERPHCPRCGQKMSMAWQNFRNTIPENMGQAWAAAEKASHDRGLSFAVTQESGRSCQVRLYDRATGADVVPVLKGEHACLVLCAALVWDHLPEEERAHYLVPGASAGRRYLYNLEHRLRLANGSEEQTLAYMSPELAPILDFMARNKDADTRPDVTWWWALSLDQVGADWGFVDPCDGEREDLWIFSRDGELMNYQPLGGYQAYGPLDPEGPTPTMPPAVAGGT